MDLKFLRTFLVQQQVQPNSASVSHVTFQNHIDLDSCNTSCYQKWKEHSQISLQANFQVYFHFFLQVIAHYLLSYFLAQIYPKRTTKALTLKIFRLDCILRAIKTMFLTLKGTMSTPVLFIWESPPQRRSHAGQLG